MNKPSPSSLQRTHAWEGIIPDTDLQVYEAAGFGRKTELGTSPAVVVIDVQYRTVGPEPVPILEAIEMYPTACGEVAWDAVAAIERLLLAARANDVPIFYPYVAPKYSGQGGRLADKVPAIMDVGTQGYDFVAEVAPRSEDIVIPKDHPSAFFGTAFISNLIDRGIDSLVLSGCTTSGCVRATAADAFAYNFRTAVVEECVYDRGQVAHAASLFDMDQKYANVVWLDDAIEYLSA